MYWNRIELLGDEYQIDRLIPFLKDLDRCYLHNLKSAYTSKGWVEFTWYDESERHIVSTEIHIPDGDIWAAENKFMKRARHSSDTDLQDIIDSPDSRDFKIKSFIKKHLQLCQVHFYSTNGQTTYKTVNGRKIIDLARYEIGYSDKTSPIDIWATLFNNFCEIMNIDEDQRKKILKSET
jgi:hypothetical protein